MLGYTRTFVLITIMGLQFWSFPSIAADREEIQHLQIAQTYYTLLNDMRQLDRRIKLIEQKLRNIDKWSNDIDNFVRQSQRQLSSTEPSPRFTTIPPIKKIDRPSGKVDTPFIVQRNIDALWEQVYEIVNIVNGISEKDQLSRRGLTNQSSVISLKKIDRPSGKADTPLIVQKNIDALWEQLYEILNTIKKISGRQYIN